ncbi:MAG: hypothetical protein IEMM0008_0623 [bacterium]|nr:MAG: hypothetical protein IEMM0008_0623 [bacterium]
MAKSCTGSNHKELKLRIKRKKSISLKRNIIYKSNYVYYTLNACKLNFSFSSPFMGEAGRG